METGTRENELKKLASALCTKPGGSARDLAAAAGISKATFYRVYSSKDHLEEILTERAEEVVEGLFAITEKDITSRNALSEMMRWCCDNREYLMFLCRSVIPIQSGPASGGNGAKIARIRFLRPLIRFDLLELKSIYSSLLLSCASSTNVCDVTKSPNAST